MGTYARVESPDGPLLDIPIQPGEADRNVQVRGECVDFAGAAVQHDAAEVPTSWSAIAFTISLLCDDDGCRRTFATFWPSRRLMFVSFIPMRNSRGHREVF